ncbi:MAG: MBL fold metallo-hydrolase, partial [Dehalococcoidales bacterium]|nr:MBL fold metallo-hydrolase [Dehalococcoidales bacterium]
ALPALPGTIIGGALAGGLGQVFLPAAQVVGWVAWLFTSYLLLMVRVFAVYPPVESGPVNTTLILLYYSTLALIIWAGSQRRKLAELIPGALNSFPGLSVRWVVFPLAVLAVLVLAAATMPDDNLRVSFLDVGQGNAILIQKGSQQVLVDGGPDPRAISLALGTEMPFWDRTIDLVVLTHPHADHLTGLVAVLKRYQVKRVLYPDSADDSLLYNEWSSIIEEKDIARTPARAGQRIRLGEALIEVLNPQMSLLTGTESDMDNNGVVLRLEMDEVSFLLTADIMREAELALITRRAELTSTVLGVAHHGSSTSTTAGFLAVVDPRLAVISLDKDNRFGHPHLEVWQRLAQKLGQGNIYRTDERGIIEFTTDGNRLWVKVER